jgi:hypothetical protein
MSSIDVNALWAVGLTALTSGLLIISFAARRAAALQAVRVVAARGPRHRLRG